MWHPPRMSVKRVKRDPHIPKDESSWGEVVRGQRDPQCAAQTPDRVDLIQSSELRMKKKNYWKRDILVFIQQSFHESFWSIFSLRAFFCRVAKYNDTSNVTNRTLLNAGIWLVQCFFFLPPPPRKNVFSVVFFCHIITDYRKVWVQFLSWLLVIQSTMLI